jgi:hypothetical protein
VDNSAEVEREQRVLTVFAIISVTRIRNNPGVWRRVICRSVARRIRHRWRTSGSTGTPGSGAAVGGGSQRTGSGILGSLPCGNRTVESISTTGLSRKYCLNERRTLYAVMYLVLLQRCNRVNDRPLPWRVHDIRHWCDVVYRHVELIGTVPVGLPPFLEKFLS